MAARIVTPRSLDAVGLNIDAVVRLPGIWEAGAGMHARMFAFEGSPEEIEAAGALAREEILPLERRMPGFRGLILLADETERRLVSVSLWESEELMRRSEESARMLVRLGAQSVGGKRVSIEPFDVALFELG